MSKRREKNRKLLTEINVIPYVDVSLVLLVIFMVATPFMIQGIDLDLPKTLAGITLVLLKTNTSPGFK